jgi:hypothetical protein
VRLTRSQCFIDRSLIWAALANSMLAICLQGESSKCRVSQVSGRAKRVQGSGSGVVVASLSNLGCWSSSQVHKGSAHTRAPANKEHCRHSEVSTQALRDCYWVQWQDTAGCTHSPFEGVQVYTPLSQNQLLVDAGHVCTPSLVGKYQNSLSGHEHTPAPGRCRAPAQLQLQRQQFGLTSKSQGEGH